MKFKKSFSFQSSILNPRSFHDLTFASEIDSNTPNFMADHQLFQIPVVAAATYLSILLAATKEAFNTTHFAFADIEFLQPLILSKDNAITLQTIINCNNSEKQLSITSQSNQSNPADKTQHVQAKIQEKLFSKLELPNETIEIIQQRCHCATYSAEIIYKAAQDAGLQLGEHFRWLKTVYVGKDELLASLRLPISDENDYPLFPGFIDNCFQAMFALAINNNAINLYLPFSIKEFICDISDDKPVWAHAKLNEASSTLNEFIQADFSLYTEKGKKVGQINGFAAKTADRTKLLQSMTESKEIKQRLSQLTLIPDFQVYLKTIAPAERHSVLSDYLCSLLRKILSLDANIPLDNYQGFFSLGIDSLMAVELKNALQVSMKNHDLPATIIFDRPNIHELADYILTILFETNRGEPICPPDERRATIIRKDVNTLTDDEVRNDLLALLGEAKPIEKIDLKDAVYELLPAKSGLLDELKLHPKPKSRVLRGQVEIAVRATGLNFLDLLIALGRRPGGINSMGGECAGEITAVGEGVNNIKVGDAVLGIARNSFSNSVITLADLVIQKPTSLSFAQAAAIPIVFLTVHYALNHVAKIKAGDKILIHAAAGGVGLAAIQMAKRVGAEIIATAGSPPKRDFLKGLNVSHIFDSRSLVFAEQVMDITRGQGVDIVLNSLAGEFIPKSLSTVTKGGWFLEIGKTGPWSKQQVAQTYPGINYDIVALDQIVITKPNFLQTLLVETMEMFNKGELSPLPQTLFPLTDAQSAFRYMQQAKHIGKIVVTQQ